MTGHDQAKPDALVGQWLMTTLRDVIDERLKDAITPPLPRLLSVKAVAAITSLSVAEVRKLIAKRELRTVRYGTRVLVPREAVDEWADALIAAQERPALKAVRGNGRR